MSTPHEHLAQADERELLVVLLNNDPGSPPFEKAKAILEQRLLAQQVVFMRRLVWATWGLVAVTVALVVTTVVQVVGPCR